MTKADFNRANKYLKSKLPDYDRFKLCETTGRPILRTRHDTGTFISISVETLFDIVNELSRKKD
jgi:hypothetical protein